MTRSFLLLLVAPVLAGLCATATLANASDLVVLERADRTVKILPQAAGRVVYFARKGGQNVLKEAPEFWRDAENQVPKPETWTGEPELHGHMIWGGPQAEFWAHQNIRPDVRGKPWPPDPWSELARYQVVESGAASAVLEGPPSPVSGLRMTKHYELLDTGHLRLRVVAVNCRETPVSWDLWSVTRLETSGAAYALHQGPDLPRVNPSAKPTIELTATFERGLFSLVPTPPSTGTVIQGFKYFVTPRPGQEAILLYLRPGEAFLKTFRPTPPEQVHPEHGTIEIFADRNDGAGGKLELEFHGPYVTLAPGASMSLEETWELRSVQVTEDRGNWEAIARGILLPEE